jgi:glutathione peroxidase-family protein
MSENGPGSGPGSGPESEPGSGTTTSASSREPSPPTVPVKGQTTKKLNLQDIINNTTLQVNNPKVSYNLNVNDDSKFVVATYWWGRRNDNNNTARPCISFFEEITSAVVKFAINYVITLYKNKNFSNLNDESILSNMVDNISKLASFNKIVVKYAKVYMNMVYYNLGLSTPEFKLKRDDNVSGDALKEVEDYNKDIKQKQYEAAVAIIEKMKGTDKTQLSLPLQNQKTVLFYEFTDATNTENDLREILLKVIEETKIHIVDTASVKMQVDNLKALYLKTIQKGYENIDYPGAEFLKDEFLNETNRLKQTKKELAAEIVKQLKTKKKDPPYKLLTYTYDETNYNNVEKTKRGTYAVFPPFAGYNLYDILNERFRFFEPIKFETMIENWGAECAKFGCNYLSVEYPEFAEQGGYQMAINAKPLFIQKALELVKKETGKELGVLYIDGDMFIRKYPTIFDTPNVDFMARGWWIDPRSSFRMEESITYDPYTFETSGGTMFFSQSDESKALIRAWIDASDKSYQAGKADDRILSLIFNTQKWLLSANVIQLPIEYLWLTLDYDDRLKETLYDWVVPNMRETIFIEHPECLTSEETATGAGASNDRSPKFYTFLDLDEAKTPVSEEAYECVMFETKEDSLAFKPYHEYMMNAYYIDDGNEQLLLRKLINTTDPDFNEQPLYITPFDKDYGRRQAIVNENMRLLTREDELNNSATVPYIEKKFDLTTKKETGDKIENFIRTNPQLEPNQFTFQIVTLKPVGDAPEKKTKKSTPYVMDETYEIPLILSLLSHGYSVIYSHSSKEFDQTDIDKALRKYVNTNLELIFFPKMSDMDHNLKPVIDFEKPIIFRAKDEGLKMMIKVLSMFSSLQDFSEYLNRGNYQIMSRIRMGYVFSGSKGLKERGGQRGGEGGGEGGEQSMFEHNYEEALEKYYLAQQNDGADAVEVEGAVAPVGAIESEGGGRRKKLRTRRPARVHRKRTRRH